jgi:stage III sporulation protein AH
MRRNWKQNGVLITMLVLVGTAVYLNWRYTTEPIEETGTKILGEATLVSGDSGALTPDAVTGETAVYTGGDYFASARLTRQQARDAALELLEEAAAKEGAQESVLTDAAESIQVMAAHTLAEAQIENLVTAKGYVDCVAFMSDDSVSVVVSLKDAELTATDVAKIMDIAKTETGYPADKIKVMAAN